MFKKIYAILALPAMLLAASCDKTAEGTLYRPNSDDGKEIHFSVSSIVKSFAEDDKAGIIELTLVRPGTLGNHTLGLAQMGTDEDMFSFPSEVTIEDGEYCAVVPVLVDLSSFIKGSSYSTSIYIVSRDQATGNYGVKNASYSDAVDITASVDLVWEPLMVEDSVTGALVQQTATYYYNAFWSGTSTGLPVEKAVCEEKIYRVSGWGTTGVMLMWQVKSDNTCVLPKQNTGYFNSSYNQYIYVSDYPSNGTNSSYTYKSYPCTWDGERTFTFNTIYYREGSTGNFGKGEEKIVFESAADRLPSVDLLYEGVDSTMTGFVGAALKFAPNDYARSYSVAFCDGALDSLAIASVADSLAAGSKDVGEGRNVFDFYESDSQNWAMEKGPHTLVAVAFDAEGVCGKPSSLVFTFDPAGEYCVKVKEFMFDNDASSELYDPTTSLRVFLKTENFVRGWYSCRKISGWNSLLKKQSMEEILLGGTEFSASAIQSCNGTKGRTSHYTSLEPGTTYMYAALLENEYGERVLISMEATTSVKGSSSAADDFDPDVTVDDFCGSYLMTAGVGSSQAAASDVTFRVDINRMDDNRVVISGLASPIDGFSPKLVATFDAVRHCLLLDPQDVGMYDGNYVRLAFCTGSSYVYATGDFLLGMEDGNIVWVSDPESSYVFVGYAFWQFSGLPCTSATSLKKTVDSKTFFNPVMKPLAAN